MPTKRPELPYGSLNGALAAIEDMVQKRLMEKGPGSFSSSHEILGILQEELREYEETVILNLHPGAKVDELIDIAVGCVMGIASITSGGVDW